MSWACAIDGDPCDVYVDTDVKAARKEHKCCFCENQIKIGTPYRKTFWVYDGYPGTEKMHRKCWYLMQEAAELICGESTVAFDSTLEGAANELLAGEFDTHFDCDPELVKGWMLSYGEVLEKYGR